MPPDFVPANAHQYNGMNPDYSRNPPRDGRNGAQHTHQAYPSTGSVMFGGYSDSNTSSPAPPLSGTHPPPPFNPHPLPAVGHHIAPQSNGSHSQQVSNGYSPMGPPPPPGYYPHLDGFVAGPAHDNVTRRQIVAFGPLEGDSSSGNPVENHRAYDPSTPHSFQGSQSSAQEQEVGPPFHNQYPTAVITNGSNGHIDDVRLYQGPRTNDQNNARPYAAHSSSQSAQTHQLVDHLDGLILYLQSHFADATWADWTLELRYSDDRATPVRIPGQSLLFARSPTLKRMMTTQSGEGEGFGSRTLFIQSEDRFLRSDGFWLAMQRLYGAPLLDLGPLSTASLTGDSSQSPMLGAPAERFDVALGYAAAGHILQITPVVNRGIELAAYLLNWTTVEKAFDFALEGGLDSQWTMAPSQSGSLTFYGPTANMLLYTALQFIIVNFPPSFEPDLSTGDFRHNCRLPFVPEAPASAHHSRLKSIKFGDHSTEESNHSINANSPILALSRLLLNLPFHLLKYIMQSPHLGHERAWSSPPLRHRLLESIVKERETRRIKIHKSHVPNVERATNFKEWESVGWQETVDPLSSNDVVPVLSRTWIDFKLPQAS